MITKKGPSDEELDEILKQEEEENFLSLESLLQIKFINPMIA